MNDDEFEKKLRDLSGSLRRPDPTPGWKSDILARARREATAIPMSRTRPPRWLMASWAAAWTAIFVLHFTAPTEDSPPVAKSLASTDGSRPTEAEVGPTASNETLFAFQRRMDLNLDQP